MGVEFRWGWNLGRGRVWEAGPRRVGGVTFECGAGPLLRPCAEGERQHVERRGSGVWSSRVRR